MSDILKSLGIEQLKTWNNTSPSQIGTYRRCSRAWWWNKIGGLATPETASQRTGKEKHAHLEGYLNGDHALTDPVCRAGLPYLPPLESKLLIEERFELKRPELPVKLVGVIDMVVMDENKITDHKTTSNFKYCKTEEELKGDPQSVAYSKYAIEELFHGIDQITFQHIYYRTKSGPKSCETSVEMNRERIEKGWNAIVETSAAMHIDSKKTDPRDVEPNLSACGDYGGCPFRTQCANVGTHTMGELSGLFRTVPKSDTEKENDEMSKNNLMALLKRRQNGTATPDLPPKEEASKALPPSTAAIVPPDAPDEYDIPPAPEPKKSKAVKKSPPPADTAEMSDDALVELVKAGQHTKLKKAALLEAAKRVQALTGSQDPKLVKGTKGDICQAMEQAVNGQSVEPETDETPAPEPTEEAEAAIPGEPKTFPGVADEMNKQAEQLEDINDGLQERLAIVSVELEASETREEATREKCIELQQKCNALEAEAQRLHDEKEAMRERGLGRELYIGCIPRRLSPDEPPVEYLDRLLVPFQDQVAANAELPHYGLVEYGNGSKRVAALVRHAIRENKLKLPARLHADRRIPCTDDVLEVLIPVYDRVFDRN